MALQDVWLIVESEVLASVDAGTTTVTPPKSLVPQSDAQMANAGLIQSGELISHVENHGFGKTLVKRPMTRDAVTDLVKSLTSGAENAVSRGSTSVADYDVVAIFSSRKSPDAFLAVDALQSREQKLRRVHQIVLVVIFAFLVVWSAAFGYFVYTLGNRDGTFGGLLFILVLGAVLVCLAIFGGPLRRMEEERKRINDATRADVNLDDPKLKAAYREAQTHATMTVLVQEKMSGTSLSEEQRFNQIMSLTHNALREKGYPLSVEQFTHFMNNTSLVGD